MRASAWAGVLVASGLLALSAAGQEPAARPRRLLYLVHSAGFRHDVLPLTKEVVPALGRESGGFEATVTEDCGLVRADTLAGYDAVMFYTTGELPMSDAQKQDLLAFVRSGRGFVGVHSATDTFYKWPAYGELIGGYFDGHPWHEEVVVRVEDRTHPSTRHLGESFRVTDEIYQFRDWSRAAVHVLLSLDPSSVDLARPGVKRTDRDFALAWTRNYGRGRVFYTALGHRPEVWRDPRFRQHLTGGIRWAMGAE
ncbi:MAG TPA: ThuA domain-containing protein [Vicinamibacterales bacterium]|nr:ThuA domain-containing protein [Vicinamibacterales bacterium]